MKLAAFDSAAARGLSPSAGGRGLKQLNPVLLPIFFIVALRRRAWIETRWRRDISRIIWCRPPQEGVD